MALYREDLDRLAKAGCQDPECDGDHGDHQEEGEIFLHATCHVGGPKDVVYQGGIIRVTCSVCGKHVVAIEVASKKHGEGHQLEN